MAMIDYGAILRVDGKFVNKNKGLFMEVSDTGYEPPEKVYDPKYNNTFSIKGNYFVYAGDENFLVCFYKCYLCAVNKNKIIFDYWGDDFSHQFILPNEKIIKVEHLDNMRYKESPFFDDDILDIASEYRKNNKTRQLKRLHRILKSRHRYSKNPYKYKTNRYIATWEHNGHNYECIFGYGIDPNEEVWEDIKDEHYDFTDIERNIIDMWFKE